MTETTVAQLVGEVYLAALPAEPSRLLAQRARSQSTSDACDEATGLSD